jgi:lysophospholipase L1-like esterase
MRWRRLIRSMLVLAALPAAASATPLRLVLVGDSITAGQIADTGDPYAVQLADALEPDWDVVNVGCGGTSSLDWRPSPGSTLCGSLGFQLPNLYTARALPELPADVVTILLGTNDALGFYEPQPVAPADYGAAIAEIALQLVRDGADHVLLLTPPPNFGSQIANLYLQLYRDEVLARCDGLDPRILCGPDVYELLDPTDFIAGNIHPLLSGHTKIADALYESVTALEPIPQPGSLPLLAGGLGLLCCVRRRTRRDAAPGDAPRPPARGAGGPRRSA